VCFKCTQIYHFHFHVSLTVPIDKHDTYMIIVQIQYYYYAPSAVNRDLRSCTDNRELCVVCRKFNIYVYALHGISSRSLTKTIAAHMFVSKGKPRPGRYLGRANRTTTVIGLFLLLVGVAEMLVASLRLASKSKMVQIQTTWR
jgi:hypothetical protein